MSDFVNIKDYDASIHREILDSLTRDDQAIIEICEDRAIAEASSYLSRRYDCDKIFSATGSDRHPLILMFIIDITVYHIFCIHNPQKMSQIRRDRYDRALTWLQEVANYEISIYGAPELQEEEIIKKSTNILKSNPKRSNAL